MKKFPAIAIIELSSIATGIFTCDIMVKYSPVSLLRSGTVHNGKYIILISGTVAAVEEAYNRGISAGSDNILDKVMIPDIHPAVYDSILGKKMPCKMESLAVFETSSIPAVILSADSAVKGSDVNIVEIRLADDIGGKGIVIYTGKLEEVETAVELGKEALIDKNKIINSSIMSRLNDDMAEQLDISTKFSDLDVKVLKDGEG
ncbi:MAG: BMC domain-containing protein [Acidobacteriota bacterium]